MLKKLKHSLLFIALLMGAALACQMSGDLAQIEKVPIMTEEANAVAEKVEQAIQEAEQKGTFTIEITEVQLTSYLALSLAENSEVPISDLQVRLRDEQVWISGNAQTENLELPLMVVVKLSVGSANELMIEFTKAQVGPFPLPKIMLDRITEQVEKAFLAEVAKVGEGYAIEEISIGEGSLLIRGAKK